MKQLYTLLIGLFITTTALGQTGGIKGKIQTSDGKAAPYVNVWVKNTKKGTTTNEKGEYNIRGIQPGAHTLVASFVGMKTQEIRVNVNAGENKEVPAITLEENIKELKEIIVAAEREENNDYFAKIPSRSLRLQTPLNEIPQNIQVITDDVIRDQQSVDMLENVSRNVSGVQMIEHWGNFARINMRGFKIPAFRNGMNVEMPWGPLTEDMSIVERIEFVKGPAGFMLSSGEPGGLYNVVTKKPRENHRNNVSIMTGSFNTLRATADLGGKIKDDGNTLYRLNVMGMNKGSHRDFEFNKRFTIAPSVTQKINEKTSITGEYIYQYSRMSVVGAAYVFSPEGFGNLPRDITFAEPNIDPTDINEHNVFLRLNHRINANWELTAQLGYLHYKQVGSSLWPARVDSSGEVYRGLSIWDALNESKLGQVFVNGDLKTGPVQHRILAGLDMGQKDYFADWFQTVNLGGNVPFDIHDPSHGVPSDSIAEFDRSSSIRKRAYGSYPAIVGQRYSSAYLQDVITVLDNRIRLTLAGRYTYYDGWSYGSSSEDFVFSPRAGLSVSLTDQLSVYGLYDQGFIPKTGASADGTPFKPVLALNNEVGIKKEWSDGKWSTTLAAYQITKDNVLTTDPENPFYSVQLGQVQSKGLEFDLRGEVLSGLQAVVNYANTEVVVTEDTDESIIGDRIAGHARHMANAWLQYRFSKNLLKGWGISAGYMYQADRSSWNWGAENESVLPDYGRLDGGISWQGNNLIAGLKVNNILDEYLYSGAAYSNYYYWQTEPGINFRLNVGYQF